jgi:LytS/YehU family sensor histidine kinase
LQPLVENAVRHGARAEDGEGRVSVHIRREAEMLRLSVEDSGARGARARADEESGGIGLTNTRARLHHLFGERHQLSLTPTPAGGTVAEVVIPFQRVEALS